MSRPVPVPGSPLKLTTTNQFQEREEILSFDGPPNQLETDHTYKKQSKEMKLRKVFLPVIALMALPLGAIPARADQKVKIGVTMASFGHTFHISMMDGMKKWAEAHPDVELSMVDARDDSAKQTGQVENFLAQGMDAIIVQPVGASATGSMSKMAIKAGKPLVYINRKPEKLPQGVLYCGSNSIDSGIMNMEELGKCMGGKGNVVILLGELSNEATQARTDGIKKVIKEKFPDIKVTREQTADWTREKAKSVMENWLASGQEIDGVASNNDEMALGALQAIKAAGKQGKICVGGVDATRDALESMDKGELNNTVFQDGAGQGAEAVNAAYLAVKKGSNPKVVDGSILIPYQPVTKENYKSFMK